MRVTLFSIAMLLMNSLFAMEPKNVTIMCTDGPINLSENLVEVSPVWKAMLALNEQYKNQSTIYSELSKEEIEVLRPFLELIPQGKQNTLEATIKAADLPTLCLLYSLGDFLQIEPLVKYARAVLVTKIKEQDSLQQFLDDEQCTPLLQRLPEDFQEELADSLMEQSTVIKHYRNYLIKINTLLVPCSYDSLPPQLNALHDTSAYITKNTIYCYSFATKTYKTIHVPESITAYAWHPTRPYIIACIDGHETIGIWNIKTGKKIHTIRGKKKILAFAWNPHEPDIIAYSDEKNLVVYNVATATHSILAPCSHPFDHIIWDPCNTDCLLAYGNSTVDLWDVQKKVIILNLELEDCFHYQVLLHPHNATIAIAYLHFVHLINRKTGEQKIINTLFLVERVFGSPHSPIIAILSSSSIFLYDSITGKLLRTLPESADSIIWHPFLPHILISVSRDGSNLRIWNSNTGCCLHTIKGFCGIVSFGLSKQGILALCSVTSTTQRLIRTLQTLNSQPLYLQVLNLQSLFDLIAIPYTLPQALLLYALNNNLTMKFEKKHLQDIINRMDPVYQQIVLPLVTIDEQWPLLNKSLSYNDNPAQWYIKVDLPAHFLNLGLVTSSLLANRMTTVFGNTKNKTQSS